MPAIRKCSEVVPSRALPRSLGFQYLLTEFNGPYITVWIILSDWSVVTNIPPHFSCLKMCIICSWTETLQSVLPSPNPMLFWYSKLNVIYPSLSENSSFLWVVFKLTSMFSGSVLSRLNVWLYRLTTHLRYVKMFLFYHFCFLFSAANSGNTKGNKFTQRWRK